MTSMIPPITTHESATLNTGHHWTSMKSMTPPPKNPLPRKARSAKLPSAPPRIRPSATAPARLPIVRPCHSRKPTTPSARTAMIGPAPPARLKAAPVLVVTCKRSVQNSAIGSPVRRSMAHHLVSWSTVNAVAATTASRTRCDDCSDRIADSSTGGSRRPCIPPVHEPTEWRGAAPSGWPSQKPRRARRCSR